MEFINITLMAVIVEGIVSYGKMIFVERKIQWQVIAAIALGVSVSVNYQLDLLSQLGFSGTIPCAGCVLTAILISRGANYMHSFGKTVHKALNGGGFND